MSALDCINQLLQRHSDDPFGVLREYGMQAELRQLLLEAFPERIPVTFTQPKTPGRFEWKIPPLTKRVQLEMKICLRANEQVERGRTDLIVFRKGEPVELYCHGNGPGDIVASVRARDVAIAIETKASPSRTFEQCSKYARDLQRLLVQSEYGIQTFFVLLDKSHPRYGAATTSKWSTRTVDMHDWANLLIHLPDVSITETLPPQYKALATLCYLNNAGRPSNAFAWR